jgi:hypothetical protein
MEKGSKKIFIYDTTNKFSEFIRDMYLWNYSIDICDDSTSIDNYNYAVYDVFFINVNEPKDFSLLFKTVRNSNSVLFLGTDLMEVKKLFGVHKRIRNLNTMQNRSQLKKFIDSNITVAC